MSNREPWPWQRDLEDVLRRELLMVAESVEPSADGLARIQSRIRAQRLARSGWTMAAPAGTGMPGGFPMRHLLSIHQAAQALLYTGLHRFRPSDQTMGWHRWLRPMAALATASFVVVAGAWAVTALPQLIAPSSSSSRPDASNAGIPGTRSSGGTPPTTGSVTGPGPGSNPGAYPPPGHHGSSAQSGSQPPGSPATPGSTAPTSSNSPSTPANSCPPSASPSPAGNGRHPRKPHCHKPHHGNPHSSSSDETSPPPTSGD